MDCATGIESLPFPDEIVLKILGYLSLGELIQCTRVSKRLNTICNDNSLSYRKSMFVMKDIIVKDRKSIIDILIARPELKEVTISWKGEPGTLEPGVSGFTSTILPLYFWISKTTLNHGVRNKWREK